MTPRAKLTGWIRIVSVLAISATFSIESRGAETAFHRVMWNATSLRPAEWDALAAAGYTLVHSPDRDPDAFRAMMDEAVKRGMRMVAGSWQVRQVPWLHIRLESSAPDAPLLLSAEVRHHFLDEHASLVFLAAEGHPLRMKTIPLGAGSITNVGALAAELNSLGFGLSARVQDGKADLRADFLGAAQYQIGPTETALVGNELPRAYRHVVERITDHPGLFALVPFENPDRVPASRAFQKYVREQIRSWASQVPVFLMVSTLEPGTFAHDHRVAHEAFDGIIHDIDPGALPWGADAIRQRMLKWWEVHQHNPPRNWIILARAFADAAEAVPGPASLIAQWEAARLAGLPITGFGFNGWDGHPFAVSTVPHLLEEALEAARRMRDNHPPRAISETTAFPGAPQVFYREAEDYDWVPEDGGGVPGAAEFGVHYGEGRDGRRGTDFIQVTTGEGDFAAWRDPGEVSLESGGSDTGINIRSSGPVDWWQYSFDFPAAGLARVRAYLASGAEAAAMRLYWNDRAAGEVKITGAGEQNYIAALSPIFPVGPGRGTLKFKPLEPGVNFARFELEFLPSLDTDSDGIADLADLDDDQDGFSDADESTGSQSDPLANSSRPNDTDADFISDINDEDLDGDGVNNSSDPAPAIANRAPILDAVASIRVRAGETLRIALPARDPDSPATALTFAVLGQLPAGATLNASGVFEWTPGGEEIGKTGTITYSVTDAGQPPLSTTNSFEITVTEPLADGFSLVTITTTNGPLSIVVPRKEYEFGGAKRKLYLARDGSDANPGTIERPWQSFAAAINQLAPGDVLYVREGVYPEPFVVNRSGTLADPIIVSVFPGERARIVQTPEWRAANPHRATVQIGPGAQHVWLYGLGIEGGLEPGAEYSTGFDRSGISLAGPADGCRIINNLISRCHDAGIQTGWSGGARSDYLIEGNVVWECGAPGQGAGMVLGARGNKGAIVRGNAIVNCGAGINLWGSATEGNFVTDIYLYNNLLVRNGPYNLSLRAARENLLANNVFALAAGGLQGAAVLVSRDSEANLFQNDVFYGNWLRHVGLDHSPASDLISTNVFEYLVFDPGSDLTADPQILDWFGAGNTNAEPQFANARGFDFRAAHATSLRETPFASALPGALPVETPGLFSASKYWQPELVRDNVEVIEGQEFEFRLPLAQAHPSHQVRFQPAAPLPPGALFDSETGILRWTPGETDGPGAFRLAFVGVADESPVLSGVSSIFFRVQEVNVPPSFTKGADVIVAEDSAPTVIPNWATELSTGPIGDAGQTLSFFIESDNPALFSAGPEISSEGTLSFQLKTDAHGTANLLVHAVDDGGTANGGADTSEAQAFTISATPLNDPPVARSLDLTVPEDQLVVLPAASHEPDDEPVTFRITETPRNGTVSTTGGVLTYQPALDFTGSDSFRFILTDAASQSEEATIRMMITPVNDAPRTMPDRLTARRNTLLRIDPGALLVNDHDPEGDLLTVTSVSQASAQGGGVAFFFGSLITYTPPQDHLGADEFTYTVRDATGLESAGVVAVNVEAGNQPPAVVVRTSGGETVFVPPASILVEAVASDPDGTVAKVEFFLGGEKISEDLEFPFVVALGNLAFGAYDISATATDNFGGTANSPLLTIEVRLFEPPVDAFFQSPTVSLFGEFRARFTGTRRREYVFETSEDLQTWTEVRAEILDAEGRAEFVHQGSGRRRYYRAYLKE